MARSSVNRAGQMENRRSSRRSFVRDAAAFSLATLAVPALVTAQGETPATPNSALPAEVRDAFAMRQSASSLLPEPLPRDVVLDLLWCAWGINRADSGKRTAPSAMNRQEIDLYVLLPDGAFVYDAKATDLMPVVAEDLRKAAAGQAWMQAAPVHLVYVADFARVPGGSSERWQLFSASHAGFIGQNVYLYCAAAGLGTRFHASVNATALKAALKLRDDQAVLFGQVVGRMP